ncbi:Ferritin Dps family protein [Pseudopedobacter saltans DSM 12145]|uniref:Ferritin n=1 Tax=Pseudopedobacter saltans (strain ATCC 51119 / DSM 12145 / JCM 21818 / CCUG 39354 / LMG 10337 / NBRC 100064 / NCIMB 13643) TaxID=762903 RepID=F0S6S1_PSESL|nr:ferritin [Pseudopedobacter saltans]ADY52181.1 Ferritin Dps family protein [Pseudopedobacter saltans DSM 12145]
MQTNRLSQEMSIALNSQVTLEAFAAQVYLMLSSWADDAGLDGISAFLLKHSQEERVHMAKIMEYIQERGGKVTIEAIPKPEPEPKNAQECFETVLKQEIENSEAIYKLVDLSMAEKDWATFNFLQWLVAEQREEEKLALTLLDKVNLAGGKEASYASIYELNKDIGGTGQEFPTADEENPLE